MNENKNLVRMEDDTDERDVKKDKRTSRSQNHKSKNKQYDKKQKGAPKKSTDDYNDLSYYFKDPTILDQSTQLAFQSFLGSGGLGRYEVPSIMTIYLNPSPGINWKGASASLDHPAKSGINMAALKLFNLLSMHSGRNMVYSPINIATAILEMGQLLSTVSFLRRALGVVKTTNIRNRMYPRMIVEAMGIDYDDLVANWANYRARLNNEIAAVNQVPILYNCGYLRKCANQFDYIFTDSESSMAQSYMFVPETTWIIEEASDPRGTYLRTIPFVGEKTWEARRGTYSTNKTFADYITNVLRPIIDSLLQSSTLNLVYADLLNLAGKMQIPMYTIPLVEDTYSVVPIHNWEALVHIHNLTCVGTPGLTTEGDNYTPYNDVCPDPDTNDIKYNPGFYVGLNALKADKIPYQYGIFDSPVPDPDVKVRAEMSRYKSVLTHNVVHEGEFDFFVYAILTDWYATKINIYQNQDHDDPNNGVIWIAGNFKPYQNRIAEYQASDLDTVLSQFDWAPMLGWFDATDATGYDSLESIQGDLNFYTTVGVKYLSRLNDIVYFGLFDF